MATDSAAPTASTRPASEAPGTRHLWQFPVFLLGLGSFLAVWQGWLPLGARDPAATFDHDVVALRAACEKSAPDPAELESLVNRVATEADSFPEQAPTAHFVLGTAYTRLAELTPDLGRAANDWVLARQHFDNVRSEQLSDPADIPRFAFRAAKARAATLPTNTPVAEIDLLRNLLQNVPIGENPGDGSRLLAELSLRLSPPDNKAARDALVAYIGEAGLGTPPASIARAKLRLSEICLQLNDQDQARKWLQGIGSDVPPDLLITKAAQLARILMTEGDWGGAAAEWEQVRAVAVVPPHLKPVSAYYLGVCKLKVRPPDPATAAKLFEEAVKSDGTEGPAAAVSLARLHLDTNDPARHKKAGELLAAAVARAAGPKGYANPLVPVNEVNAAFEVAVRKLQADEAFEAALAAADASKAVAPAGTDRERRAEVLAAWGTALRKAGGDFKPKLTAAAAEYVAVAPTRPKNMKAEMFRRAAALYKQAGDQAAALAALEQLVRLPDLSDEEAGPAWLEYVQGLVAANRPQDALNAFREIEKIPGPTRIEAQARLARALIGTGDPRLTPHGREMLQLLADKESVDPAEAATHERVMVELAHEYIRNVNFKGAEAVLRKQLHTYPTGPEAGLGRLLRGVCLLQLATAKPEPSEAPKMREEALRLFEQVAAEATRRQQSGKTAERDEWLRLQASLRVLQTLLQMGEPQRVITRAAPLLAQYRGTVEELIVLSLIFHAHKQWNRPDLVERTRDRMREVFEQLKKTPGAFRASTGEYSREYWEKIWFTEGGK